MESIIPRLSNEELETALAESKGHFTKVLMKRRDYISDFKLSSNNPSKASPRINNLNEKMPLKLNILLISERSDVHCTSTPSWTKNCSFSSFGS